MTNSPLTVCTQKSTIDTVSTQERVTIKVTPETHQRLKVLAALKMRTLTQVLDELASAEIERELQRNTQQNKGGDTKT